MPSARPRRSALYMPAGNPRAIEKARGLACDVVILDLEDSVAPDAKPAARDLAVAETARGGFGRRELVVRVNGLDTPWGEADLAAVRAGAVLPGAVRGAKRSVRPSPSPLRWRDNCLSARYGNVPPMPLRESYAALS